MSSPDWQSFYRDHVTRLPSELAAEHIKAAPPLRRRLPRMLLGANAGIVAIAVVAVFVRA